MIAMHVIGLSIDEQNQSPVVVLRDNSGELLFSVWLGALEAIAISLSLSGGQLPRPLTHDLLLNVLQSCGASLTSVSITHQQEGIYHARLSIQQGPDNLDIDCRPSDAITLAVRLGLPVYVSPELLHKSTTASAPDSADKALLLQSPIEIAAYIQHQSSMRLRRSLVKISSAKKNPTPQSPHQKNSQTAPLAADSTKDEEQRCADLLRSLEPESRRKM